jgi:hypothetical protein
MLHAAGNAKKCAAGKQGGKLGAAVWCLLCCDLQYGPLNLDAVVAELPVLRDSEGAFLQIQGLEQYSGADSSA